MRDFKKFEVWHLSHQLTLKIYTSTKNFPKEEMFGLTSQIRRSFASIGYNISEGSGRNSDKQFANFINIALGSSNEAENQLILARDLGYINENEYQNLSEELTLLKKKLVTLWNRLNGN
ncbi:MULTISPECIES: four helix bundle protein [Chryseobacterium]|uniref:Diversity-generating retroelement protein bAvd family protein n=1 Tax=Candidatus Chryseobacterium massiliense TaxID=204089 RepID=A0A3D9BE18_9FLAO|nr:MULTISPECIES: four helix bundle protein [Chryseobacterium]REC51840.1 diversity-generating retroelement protein bAvd family protein [Candidatus Chryseobacterium massiliae]